MAELGKAYVQIVPSAQGISGKITKELKGETDEAGEKAGESAGEGFAGKFAAMAKRVLAAVGIGKAISEAISQGSELQQNLGGTEAVWQGFADSIQSTATEAYKNMGMSASDYMATANKIGTLMQGSGIDQAAALKMTTDAMQRAADVASVMGISTEEAMNAITGAAKGNFTMMDNIGVAMNASTIEAYAKAKKGWEQFSWNTATNAEKTALAMEMFMEKTGQYAGNFARESSETMSGSLGAMKSAFEDLMGNLALGRSVAAPLRNLQTTVTAYLKNLLPAVSGIVTQLPTMLLTTVVSMAPELIQSGAEMLTGIINGFTMSVPSLITGAIMAVTAIGDTLLKAAPELLSAGLGLIKALATGLVKALPYLAGRTPEIVRTITSTVGGMAGQLANTGLQLIVSLAAGLLQALPEILSTGISLITSLITGLIRGIPALAAALPQVWETITGAFAQVDWGELGRNLIDQVKSALTTAGETLLTAAGEVWDSIKTGFGEIDWGELGQSLIDKVKTAVTTAASGLLTAAKGVWDDVKKGFADIDWTSLGSDLIEGIKKGLTNAASSLYTSVKNIIKNALGAGKDEAEVGSPSKLFAREIGRWIPAGIATGIEDNLSPVDLALRRTIDHTAESMPAAALPVTAGTSINVTMTVSGAEDPEAWAETFARSLRRQVRMGAV